MGEPGRRLASGVRGLHERKGRVEDACGAPAAGARVVVVAGPVALPELALLCDNAGRFALRLPAGRFTLRAHGAEGVTGEAEVDGAGTDEILITLDR